MRSAEADRVASCAFADRVAALSIEQYKSICPLELQNSYKQTVLAAILIEDRLENLQVVSLGVGTKTVTRQELQVDSVAVAKERLVDCHAEVLAHRGLKRFLLEEALKVIDRGVESSIFYVARTGIESLKCLHIHDGIRFHLYSSSQPCGNASVKKWAKGGKHQRWPDLPPNRFPVDAPAHSRFHVFAREQGQVAPLCKRDVVETDFKELDGSKASAAVVVPPGLCLPCSDHGFIMSCSDKIAKWNALGLQSSLLSHLLVTGPIYLSSITIGRKFGQPFCERALCCRLQDFLFPKGGSGLYSYRTHHPLVMCASVKFDMTAINTQQIAVDGSVGAQFEEPRSLVWWFGSPGQVINRSGYIVCLPPLPAPSSSSSFSSYCASIPEPEELSGIAHRRFPTLKKRSDAVEETESIIKPERKKNFSKRKNRKICACKSCVLPVDSGQQHISEGSISDVINTISSVSGKNLLELFKEVVGAIASRMENMEEENILQLVEGEDWSRGDPMYIAAKDSLMNETGSIFCGNWRTLSTYRASVNFGAAPHGVD